MVAAFSLEIENLTLIRKGKRLFGSLSLKLSSKGCCILLGPNGAGKTRFLRAVHGLEPRQSGRLTWQTGEPEKRKNPRQALVFQTPRLLHRSVAENLAYPLKLAGWPARKRKPLVEQWLERIGLQTTARLPAHRLSGGEKQKLALARALMTEPDWLLLDEPCANLDGASTFAIEKLLLEARARGLRLLMATHNLGQAQRLANEVLFFHQGRLVAQSPASAFFQHPPSPEARAFLENEIVL